MEKWLVSIIIPVYNVEEYLDRCIRSALSQTIRNIEVLIVDDGSTDSCPEICDDWAKHDRRIRVIHCSNGGLSFARNVGLDNSNGQFVLFVDSDDYLEADACEKLMTHISPGVDIVIGACKRIEMGKVEYFKHTNLEEGGLYCAKDYMIKSIQKCEWYAPVWLNLYKKSFLVENNLRFKEGVIFEDLEFIPRLFLAEPLVLFCGYAFYNYVIRDDSITTSGSMARKRETIIEILTDWYDWFNRVYDLEYRHYLLSMLCRQYLYSCRKYGIKGWMIDGIDFEFAWKYSLNCKEKIKALLFDLAPGLYLRF